MSSATARTGYGVAAMGSIWMERNAGTASARRTTPARKGTAAIHGRGGEPATRVRCQRCQRSARCGPASAIDNTGVVSNGCGGIIRNPGQITGNPVKNTCISPSDSGPSSTSTVPEFPMGSLWILALATMAAAVSLTRSSNRASGATKRLD